ncbi:aspartate aminotransferase family protein [Actinomadura madurae]|uniref:aspartate aminotransferase family protein n=1 Tax=Actinomadura madurae TaxID=1993 RepID=UPI000D8B330F|nr:aminotransferase class III-fold pyridoxal phosphate-dependent enzyme [Actinomadura madurae]SPT59109.1 Glutamate-1-semialdehyde 2,1-aminomutase [Actinomadura madurae]
MTDDRIDDGGDATAGLRPRALDVAPGGVHSNARLGHAGMFFERGSGAYLWDVAGRRYIDYVLGRGPSMLGHAPPAVLKAATAAAESGMSLGSQHPLEVQAAEKLRALLKWPEMLRFTTTGSEAAELALRVARAHTGRQEIVRFENHYHGWLVDDAPSPGGDQAAGRWPAGVDPWTHVLPWNDEDALRTLLERRGSRVAAVIMEPVMVNHRGTLPAPGYLEACRRLTRACGAQLVFDEIVTGARLAPGGAAEVFGVVPDLATYAKGIASGWPVAAVAGHRAALARVEDGTVNHRGTYNGSTASMAAVVATVDAIADGGVHRHIEEVGSRLMSGLSEVAGKAGVRLRVRGFPAAFHVALVDRDPGEPWDETVPPDMPRYQRLVEGLLGRGVWASARGNWYLSAAHTHDDVAATLDVFREALADIAADER